MDQLDTQRPLTLREVASHLRYSPATVKALATRGLLPGRKLGKEWRFDRLGIIEICRVRVQRRQTNRNR